MKNNNYEVHARIYDETEQQVWRKKIDIDVLKVVNYFNRRGYKAYIVGGAVRDLLLGIQPKDYDLVTDATPIQIRRMFANCRIIGKRFKLIHMYFAKGKIIEVATFRAAHNTNVYGRIEQDVLRRDFTFNALYYDPKNRFLIDYVGGYKDLLAQMVVPIIPLDTIFHEDPVRMIRAIKYSVGTGSKITRSLSKAIKRDFHTLAEISNSRLTEEFSKILFSGKSEAIFTLLHKYRLLQYLQPEVSRLLEAEKQTQQIKATLQQTDRQVGRDNELQLKLSVYFGLFPFQFKETTRADRLVMAKQAINPVKPPNVVVSDAIEIYYQNCRNYRKRQSKKNTRGN